MAKKLSKIIFLDFDGVLNTEYHQRQLQFEGKIWQDRQLPGRVIDITPSVISDSLLLSADLEQTSPSALHCKGAEIASWLYDNNIQDTPYAIIDDEYVILESQLPHLVLTNPYDGLTEELAMRVIGILNRQ